MSGMEVLRTGALAVVCALLAVPAAGADLRTGDLLALADAGGSCSAFPNGGGLIVFAIDPSTGDRQVVSGCDQSGGLIGSGPEITSVGQIAIIYSRTGDIWVQTNGDFFGVDPISGDRFAVPAGSGPVAVSGYGLTEVRPAPPGVAALDGWAFPALVGLLLGLGIRTVYHSRPNTRGEPA